MFGLVGTLVCAAWSWVPSVWYDEAATLSATNRSRADLWAMLHNIDAVHGAYYAVAREWMEVFGRSPVTLRLLSALAVGAAAAGLWVLVRGFASTAFASLAAACFIIIPRVTWMGIEGRSTAISAMLAVWSAVIVMRLLRTSRTGFAGWHLWLWALYAVLNGAGIAITVYFALLAPVHFLVLLVARRAKRLRDGATMVFAWIVSAAMAWPLLDLALGQTKQLPFGPDFAREILPQIVMTQYFAGALPTLDRLPTWPPEHPWGWALIVLTVVGLALAAVGAVWLARTKGAAVSVLVIAWLTIPLALVVTYSLLATPMYAPRYFCFTTPAFAVLWAAGLTSVGGAFAHSPVQRRRAVTAGFIVMVILVAPLYGLQRIPEAKNGSDMKQAAAYIASHRMPGDVLYVGWASNPNVAAYPRAFARMERPGLVAPASDVDELFDRYRRINERFTIPARVKSFWLIENPTINLATYYIDTQNERLKALGFTRVEKVVGTTQIVSRWVRTR